MPLSDMQNSPSDMQEGPQEQTNVPTPPTTVAYSPPAYTGKIVVTVDWKDEGAPPLLSAFLLPQSAWLRVGATTMSGGVLDPAGVPLQVALAPSMHATADQLTWLDVAFDEDTRLGEFEVPAGTVAGSYYLYWRSLLTENAPSTSGGIIQSAVLTID